MNDQNLSLDDTLKGILEETVDETTNESDVVKPKRTRRTKAQIEADKKAAESVEPSVSEDTTSEIPSEENLSEDNIVDESTIDSMEPEIIPDSDEPEEISEDVPESTQIIETVDPMIPEVVADTEEDALPDVVEPKTAPKKQVPTDPDPSVVKAFKGESAEESKGLIGKSFILKYATPIYRARHTSMRVKSYRGQVTITENSRNGFLKVQFLRQGFGLCEGFIEERYIYNLLEGESNENVSEET